MLKVVIFDSDGLAGVCVVKTLWVNSFQYGKEEIYTHMVDQFYLGGQVIDKEGKVVYTAGVVK